ncbi:hypothetical protein Tco_0026759 [Tanacetum coccineum]
MEKKISEKEVNNLEEHGPTPSHAEVANKDKWATVESGSMHSTLIDLQDGNSESDTEEYDNKTAEYMSSSSKRHGGGTNDPSVRELDEYDLYDGYDDVGEELEASDDEIEELDDDTARYMSFIDQASEGANDAGLFKNEDFDLYDGYKD